MKNEREPILLFMPWCRIDRTYAVGDVNIIPFRRDGPLEGVDAEVTRRVTEVLGCYKDLAGRPVREAALIQFADRPLPAELNTKQLQSAVQLARECVALACFCALATRADFVGGSYCNADCFAMYGQGIREPGFPKIFSRRRADQAVQFRRLDKTVISVPAHVAAIERVVLDEELLKGLVAFRTKALNGKEKRSSDEWWRWLNAISCFNQANTDSLTVSEQMEWVLLCAAFEQLLKAYSNAKAVAESFTRAFAVSTPLKTSDAKRPAAHSDYKWEVDKPLRYNWMKEFYRIRGSFAHGELRTVQDHAWELLEHIVLASMAFPLLVRCLLARSGEYKLTDEDRAWVNAFESIADEQFLEPPADQKSSSDTRARRLVRRELFLLEFRKARSELNEEWLKSGDPDDKTSSD